MRVSDWFPKEWFSTRLSACLKYDKWWMMYKIVYTYFSFLKWMMGGKYKSIQDQIWAKPIFRSFETILLQTCASFSFSKTSSILDLSERHSGSCLSSVAKSKCQYQWFGSVLWRLMAVIFLQMIIFLELVTNYRPDEMCIAQDPLDKINSHRKRSAASCAATSWVCAPEWKTLCLEAWVQTHQTTSVPFYRTRQLVV